MQLGSNLKFCKCALMPLFWAVSLIYLKNMYSSLPHFYLDLFHLQVNLPKSSPLSLSTILPQATMNMNKNMNMDINMSWCTLYSPNSYKKYIGVLELMKFIQHFIKRVFLYCPQQEDYWILRSWMPQKKLFWSCLPSKHKQANICPSCMGQRRLLAKVGRETRKMFYLSENCNNQ